MKQIIVVGAVALAAALVGDARASLVPVGDPVDGNSWAQAFAEDLPVSLDFMGVHMVSAGDRFESAVFRSFGGSDYAGGWNDSLGGGAFPLFGIATGPTVASSGGLNAFTFTINFDGDPSNPLVFDFVAYDGSTLVDSARASWNGAWSFSSIPQDESWDRESFERMVPLPSVAGMSGMGLMAIGLRRQRKVLA